MRAWRRSRTTNHGPSAHTYDRILYVWRQQRNLSLCPFTFLIRVAHTRSEHTIHCGLLLLYIFFVHFDYFYISSLPLPFPVCMCYYRRYHRRFCLYCVYFVPFACVWASVFRLKCGQIFGMRKWIARANAATVVTLHIYISQDPYAHAHRINVQQAGGASDAYIYIAHSA